MDQASLAADGVAGGRVRTDTRWVPRDTDDNWVPLCLDVAGRPQRAVGRRGGERGRPSWGTTDVTVRGRAETGSGGRGWTGCNVHGIRWTLGRQIGRASCRERVSVVV